MEQPHQEGVQLREVERFGRMTARYVYVARQAGHLAIGELVREPYLGSARVAGMNESEPDSPFVQVEWKDDYSAATAAVRYPADLALPVRVPAPDDWWLVQRGIKKARNLKLEIVSDIARLIAAHLHRGPRTTIHRFARDGAIRDNLYDELEAIRQRQPGYDQWINALARFLLSREDTGPLPEWQTDDPQGTTPADADRAIVRPLANSRRRSTSQRLKVSEAIGGATASMVNGNIAESKHNAIPTIGSDLADRLVQEAFALGLQAASRAGAPRAKRIVRAWEAAKQRK